MVTRGDKQEIITKYKSDFHLFELYIVHMYIWASKVGEDIHMRVEKGICGFPDQKKKKKGIQNETANSDTQRVQTPTTGLQIPQVLCKLPSTQ